MAIFKAKEMRDLSVPELENQLGDARRELFTILNEMQREKKVAKPHLKKHKRKEIARLSTVLRSKQLQEGS